MSDYHFIFNPVAGNGLSQKMFAEMEALMRDRKLNYGVARSEYAGHACELTREAVSAGHGCIIAVGGDGTVREVAQVLRDTGTPMCVLPCGTGNDVARALKIPGEPAGVLNLLLHGMPRAMDMGAANGTPFINVAGFGFDVDVLVNTERYKKRFSGLTAYTLGLLRALFGLRLRKVRVTTEEGVLERNALIVAAANGTHFGGGMNVAPEASTVDGLFDVCVVSNVNRLTVIRVLKRFVKGKHLGLPIVDYFRAKEIHVESDPPSPLQLDGEIMLETPATFRILPGALTMITGLTSDL